MAPSATEHHLLVIEDTRGKRTIHLEAATYSIGRDKSNAIVVESPGISRQHALLLRLPKADGKTYQYRLVDGNAKGKPSANGIFFKGDRIKTRNLIHGDLLLLANEVKLSYEIVTMEKAEFIKYLDTVDFHSIKSIPKTSTVTIANEELDLDPTLVSKDASLPSPPVLKIVQSTPGPASDSNLMGPKYWLVGVGGILVGIVGGGLLLWGLGMFKPNQPERPPTPEPNSWHPQGSLFS